jgi:hypothetical protein
MVSKCHFSNGRQGRTAGQKFCRGYEDTDLGMQAIRSAGMDAVDVRELITKS